MEERLKPQGVFLTRGCKGKEQKSGLFQRIQGVSRIGKKKPICRVRLGEGESSTMTHDTYPLRFFYNPRGGRIS